MGCDCKASGCGVRVSDLGPGVRVQRFGRWIRFWVLGLISSEKVYEGFLYSIYIARLKVPG